MLGQSEDAVSAEVSAHVAHTTDAAAFAAAGVGLDATDAFAAGFVSKGIQTSADIFPLPVGGSWTGYPGLGRHFLAWLEVSTTSTDYNWHGDGGSPLLTQSGIWGEVLA